MNKFREWWKEGSWNRQDSHDDCEQAWRAALRWVRDNVCEEAWTDDGIEDAIDNELGD